MKLTKADKEYLLKIGYTIEDLASIEEISKFTICKDSTGKRVSKKLVREKVGSEDFLATLGRSCFHWSSATNDGEFDFDSDKYYKRFR
jgi:hypothetical protein